MRDSDKKMPASFEKNAGEFLTLMTGEVSPFRPFVEINLWAEVLDFLLAKLQPCTLAAIQEGIERRPHYLWGITDIADKHRARHQPVAAYFGWLQQPRFDSLGRCIGQSGYWQHIYRPAPRHAEVLLPLDDIETMAALGLCRASRSDRDRQVRHLLAWRER